MLSPNDPSFFESVLSPNAPACRSAGLTPVSISNMTAPPGLQPVFGPVLKNKDAQPMGKIAPDVFKFILYPHFSEKNLNLPPAPEARVI